MTFSKKNHLTKKTSHDEPDTLCQYRHSAIFLFQNNRKMNKRSEIKYLRLLISKVKIQLDTISKTGSITNCIAY